MLGIMAFGIRSRLQWHFQDAAAPQNTRRGPTTSAWIPRGSDWQLRHGFCRVCSREGVLRTKILDGHCISTAVSVPPIHVELDILRFMISLLKRFLPISALGKDWRPYAPSTSTSSFNIAARRCQSRSLHDLMVTALNGAVRVGACSFRSLLRPASRAPGRHRASILPRLTSHRDHRSAFSSLASKRTSLSSFERPATLSRTTFNSPQSRYCSHHRRMCRDQGDIDGSMAAAGREVLPTNVKATHYDLTLEPDFKEFTFEGSVRIE